MFALDAFEPGVSFWKQILAFLIHLVPSFILTALLVVAWKWELAGGVLFAVIGVLFTPFIYTHNYQMNHSFWMSISIVLLITFPFIVVGALFIASHFFGRKEANKTNQSTFNQSTN